MALNPGRLGDAPLPLNVHQALAAWLNSRHLKLAFANYANSPAIMRFVPRTQLPHMAPTWVDDGALYFITICGKKSPGGDLTDTETATALLESVAHLHASERWFARLFLLMPDHVHALLAFSKAEGMRRVVADWKRYTARQLTVEWQRDFFDHRIRDGENWQIKADYIRANPVRKGLVAKEEDWPWVFRS